MAIAAIVAASLAAGISVANAAPGAPSITTPVDEFRTVDTTVTVSGDLPDTIDQVVTVTARLDGAVVPGCSVVVPYFDTTYSCDVTVSGPGVYELTATSYEQADVDQVPSPVSNSVTVIVGSTDTVQFTNYTSFSNAWSSRTVTLSGTGPAFGAVAIDVDYNLGDGGGTQTALLCTDTVIPATGEWSCTGTSPEWGYVYFVGYGTTVVGLETVPGSYDDEIGGDMVPLAPVSSYVLGPASIQITTQGLPTAGVYTEVYQVEIAEGEGYFYGPPVAYCPVDEGPNPVSAIETCNYSALEPGVWNFYSAQVEAGFESAFRDDYVMIPTQPGPLSAVVQPDRSVVFSGTGAPGYRVIVRGAGGNDVCSSLVGGGGAWQCTASLAAGTASYRAIQQSVGFIASPSGEGVADLSLNGFSTYTAARSVTVPAAPVVVPPSPAAVVPTPLPWALEGYDGEPLTPGQRLSLAATGLPAGTAVVVEIRSTPQVIGTTVADALGAFALDVTIPTDLEPGDHTLVAIATPPGGVASPVVIPVSVVAAPVIDPAKESVESIAPEKTDVAATGEGAAGSGLVDRSDPAAPSAISDSIPTIDRIFRTPLLAITAGGIALAILLLVAFPAELLNSTLAENTRRLGRWYAAIEGRFDRATEWFASVTRTRALAAAILVVLTSLIFGFVDPDYGFDPVSLRMTISLAIGLFIITYGASWISGAIIERVWDIPTRVGLQPAALVFAVLGVIVARLLEFSPGFLVGLVIGLDLLTRVGAPHRVRAVITNIGVMVGLALLAWVGFSIVSGLATGEPSVLSLLVSDALVATTSEGLTAALAALMPLGFLQGHEIFRRSKLLWAAVFTAVAVLFALIVLPTASGDQGDVADVGFWMLIMVIFAVVTLTLWAVLHFTGRNQADDDEPAEQPVGAARS